MSVYSNNISVENEPTVAQIAIEQPAALNIFTKYHIDYCCGGHRSLDEACNRMGLDPNQIRKELRSASDGNSSPLFRPENWSSELLADFIVENHHSYVKKAIPELHLLLNKVCNQHEEDSPELLKIRKSFLTLSDELTSHMEKEELILFPAIRRLEVQREEQHPIEKIIQAPIIAMEEEHVAAGELIRQIRILSNNYTPPDFACPTYRVTYQKLREFDNDLMRHIHLENNILFERFKKPFAPTSCTL
jgi:regulator of cell morphogenesis and NO signaling